MLNKIRATLAALIIVLVPVGMQMTTVAPAHAVETNLCNVNWAGDGQAIPVQSSENTGGHYGNIYGGQCTKSKYGWGDAQKFYVQPGKKIKVWYVSTYNQSTTVVAIVDATGWYRSAQFSGQSTVYLSSHND